MNFDIHEYAEGLPLYLYLREVDEPRTLLVFVNGLGDSLLSGRWLANFYRHFTTDPDVPWDGFAYVVLSSHHGRFGLRSLGDDAAELNAALISLSERYNQTGLTLMGHSTGCQDILYWYRHHHLTFQPPGIRLTSIILQAGISDYEASRDTIEVLHTINEWTLMRIGQEEPTLISRERFQSLFEPHGADDMFGSYLERYEYLECLQVPCHILFGEHDEGVPSSVDKRLLLERFQASNPRQINCKLLPLHHCPQDSASFDSILWPALLSSIIAIPQRNHEA
jgi:pimeloyl-ACP methyl ester carboxylesterase